MAKSSPCGLDSPHRSHHYFFKVFFPNQSSDHLRIPPAFRDHIEAESSEKISLKGPSGSLWQVNLVRNSDGFFFEDGWKEFVADHSLVSGDFLVFRYNGNSRFTVLVFDTTACEKKKAFFSKPSGEEEVVVVEGSEEEKEEESVGEEEEEEEKALVLSKHGRVKGNSKRKRGMDDHLAIKGPLRKKKKQSQSGSDCSNSERSKSRSSGRKASGALTTPRRSKSSPNTEKASVKVLRMRSLISQRRPVTDEEVGRTLRFAKSFNSKHPFAIAVMQESYVYSSFFMSLPSSFVREHLPKVNTVMTVWDPNDKPWKITYVAYSNRGALSGGWGKFSYANNLEKHDVCVFELIKKTHIRVHIFRVVKKLTPLLRHGQQ